MAWRAALLAVLTVIGAADFIAVWSIYLHHSPYQYDYRLVCDAGHALRAGLNPYLVANTPGGEGLSYPYLPAVAWVFAPLCAVAPPGSLLDPYMFLAMVCAPAWFLARGLGAGRRAALLLMAAAPAVFLGGQAVLLNGNPAVLELPFMLTAILFWHQGRPVRAAAVLGAMASIKLLPLVFLASFALLLTPRLAVRALAAGVAGFAGCFGLGLLTAGQWAGAFVLQLRGGIPGQHSAFAEAGGGASNPDLPDLLGLLAGLVGQGNPALPGTVMALLFLCLGAGLLRMREAERARLPVMASTPLFCLSLLILALSLFRLKPYGLVSLSLPALACCLNPAGRLRPWALACVVLSLPVALSLYLVPGLRGVAAYHQGIALALCVAGLGALFLARAPAALE